MYPEAGDRVRLKGDDEPDDVGRVLRSGTTPTGDPFAIVDWPQETTSTLKRDLELVERAPHNRR